ncbi:hypothetical protein GQ43DRAFT_163520 [Delitschia confertaspora ATCC 74209]|uniref:Azaphilone pigments biosynthesis cluster protein L N-terminal domain-containing protein n=1 Tax=Delitschia confertaspora ATCC 74209 TaxID=1513339 RepID=A0A9P4MSU8_9PLEO|nr:hypothetical protein GQ43DRAFT_163520 [Delitschia confertaspora ATCC 74209]
MADPLSILSGICGLLAFVGQTAVAITKFVRDVRDSRPDFLQVSSGLSVLKTILESLEHDYQSPRLLISPSLEANLLDAVHSCSHTVKEIEKLLLRYLEEKKRRKIVWAAWGQGDMEKLGRNLDAHKQILNIVLTHLDLKLTRQTKEVATKIRDTADATLENTEELKDGQMQLKRYGNYKFGLKQWEEMIRRVSRFKRLQRD